MLLDDLVEASVIELDELGQVVDVGNDIAEVLLEQHKLLLAGATLSWTTLVEAVDDVPNLALADGNAPRDLHCLDLLLGMDLLELGLELGDEARLVVLGPFVAAVGLGLAGGVPQVGLEAIVVDVVPLVLANDAGAKLLAKLHDDDAGLGLKRSRGVAVGCPGLLASLEVLDNQHVGMAKLDGSGRSSLAGASLSEPSWAAVGAKAKSEEPTEKSLPRRCFEVFFSFSFSAFLLRPGYGEEGK